MVRQCCLNDLPQGVKARIRSLECCGPERARLFSLGLTPGAEVEIRQDGHGACRVLVRDCSIILVNELARHILCDTGELGRKNLKGCALKRRARPSEKECCCNPRQPVPEEDGNLAPPLPVQVDS